MTEETATPSEPISVNCSRCGTPVVVTDDLTAAFANLPPGASITLFCPDCSASPDTPAPAPTRAERVFRVSLVLSELEEVRQVVGGENDGGEEEVWADLGGFHLRGAADSVRAFVDYQAAEFGRRMEMILAMADTPVVDEDSPGLVARMEGPVTRLKADPPNPPDTEPPTEPPSSLDLPPDGPSSV